VVGGADVECGWAPVVLNPASYRHPVTTCSGAGACSGGVFRDVGGGLSVVPMAKVGRSAIVGRQVLRKRSALRRLLYIGAAAALTLALAQSANASVSRAPHTTLTWRPEGTLSSARYALAAATARNGSIFAIGGAEGAYASSIVEVYQPKAKRWLAGPSLPRPRYRLAAATGGDGRIYALGGSDPGGEGLLNSVLALKPGQDHWQSVAPMPTARQLLAAATGPDGRIYAVGGHNYLLSSQTDGALNVLEIYDPASNQWTTGAPMPTRRYDMGVAAGADGRIYAIGGCGGGVYNVLNVVEAYSPKSNRWETLAPLPSRRCLVDATTGADGRIYAIGGCELVTDAVGNPVDCVDSKRVDAYSPRTKTWRTLDNSHAVHREGAAVTSGKRIFAIGGHTDAVESARWPTPNDPRPGPPEHPGLPGDP